MPDLIAELAAKAGVSPDMAGKAVGAILAFLKDKLPGNVFAQVQEAVPNSNNLMEVAQSTEETSGGLVSAVTSAVGKLIGGGGAAEVAGKLAKLGFSADQVQKFLPSVVEFLKTRLPPDIFKQLSGFFPAAETGG
jgi:hypothetical protein